LSPLGFMIAKPVSQVAAGNVNSGQHAIGGGFALLLLLRWVNTHMLKRPSAAPRLGGKNQSPVVLWHQATFGVCGWLAMLPFSSRFSGVGCGR